MERNGEQLRGLCSDCGKQTRLLVDLSGATGEAGYELWLCDDCGLTERMGRRRVSESALPRFGYGAMAKQRRARSRTH